MAEKKDLPLPIRAIREFIQLESASGIILFTMAVIALILDNTPLSIYYERFFDLPVKIQLGSLIVAKPLILWINDGLMAIFFLLVGLEIKREIYEGELNSLAKVSLPGIAAIGGMVFPAMIFIGLNWHDPIAIRGWAIPTATDIAFSLAILAILSSRVPTSLKIFLTALAIFDDIGAIVIIAIFYTSEISFTALILAVICLIILFTLNRFRVRALSPYMVIGVILWLCVLKSGVHATLAGVALAFAIPLRGKQSDYSPLKELEHKLHPWVAFGVLPLFSFANAGVSFAGLKVEQLFGWLSLGIIAGLFIGKQIGITLTSWLAVKMGIAKLPDDANWKSIYGISLICGVGFTMSLFIGGLAFDDMSDQTYSALVRFGVLVGSLLSGILGYLVLRFSAKPQVIKERYMLEKPKF